MASAFEQGESFYATPRKVGFWRLAIMAGLMALLWKVRHPYLDYYLDWDLWRLSRGSRGISPEDIVQIVLFLYLITPPVVKMLVLTVVLGEFLARALEALMLILVLRPFLIVSSAGLAGATGWGVQLVPWWAVTGISIRTPPDGRQERRQLVIASATLARSEGWRALVMARPADADRVAFVTPQREGAQLPAMLQAIRFYAPTELRAAGEPRSG